jgi:hypothetical protein
MAEHNILENAIKLFQAGKENYTKDEELAKKCIALSLDKLNKLKDTHKSEKYQQLIQTTEAECHKLLNNNCIQESVFKLITMNNIHAIRSIDYINFREINNSGNTVLHHAVDIGDTGILKELLKKGGLIDCVNGNGFTLLEYACLKKDPNIISFLILHGANMEKHLFFRKGTNKYYLNRSDIDIAILLKLVVTNSIKNQSSEHTRFKFLEKYFNLNELVGLDKFCIKDLLIGLHYMFNEKESYDTYKFIIIEELETYEKNKTINLCSHNKIDIVLSNMVPFINYPFNLSCIFLIKTELKYIIHNVLKYGKKDFKKILLSKLFETYIQTNLFQEDYIGIIIYNILAKIKL